MTYILLGENMNNTFMPFILTLLAGFSTMIGTVFIFIKVKNINKFICGSLAFASSVMLIVSVTDLIPESVSMLSLHYNSFFTIFLCLLFIILGIIFSMLIDYYLPSDIRVENNKLYKVGLVSLIAIVLHNIPEGIATFVAGSCDKNLAINLTIAIALHNIPEGISIAVPIFYATKNRLKAIFYTFVSSISEPFGALIAYLFLSRFNTDILLGILFAIIAGIMMQISLCELLPTSIKYNYKRVTICFFIIGIILMLLRFII